jgi:hypothetical protein
MNTILGNIMKQLTDFQKHVLKQMALIERKHYTTKDLTKYAHDYLDDCKDIDQSELEQLITLAIYQA